VDFQPSISLSGSQHMLTEKAGRFTIFECTRKCRTLSGLAVFGVNGQGVELSSGQLISDTVHRREPGDIQTSFA
jgi:hypothetical protein